MIALPAAAPPLAGLPAGSLAGLGDRPGDLLVLLGALALVPTALVLLTSFLKMAVVLSIVRSALGAPQIPPSSAITGLALVLTAVVMAPVAEEAFARAGAVPRAAPDHALAVARAAGEPLRAFLARFARPDDRRAFLDLARRARAGRAELAALGAGEVSDADWSVLAPAFVVSELRRAFSAGFLLALPFLAVDLVVANVLLALGLQQLPPTSVALPVKLLLFVAVDGWKLVARGLVAGYLAP